MHGQHMKYLLIAAGALVVGLLAAGSSLQSVLPFLLLLACPLMMVLMMHGMGGHGSHGADHRNHDEANHDEANHDEANHDEANHDDGARDHDGAATRR